MSSDVWCKWDIVHNAAYRHDWACPIYTRGSTITSSRSSTAIWPVFILKHLSPSSCIFGTIYELRSQHRCSRARAAIHCVCEASVDINWLALQSAQVNSAGKWNIFDRLFVVGCARAMYTLLSLGVNQQTYSPGWPEMLAYWWKGVVLLIFVDACIGGEGRGGNMGIARLMCFKMTYRALSYNLVHHYCFLSAQDQT